MLHIFHKIMATLYTMAKFSHELHCIQSARISRKTPEYDATKEAGVSRHERTYRKN